MHVDNELVYCGSLKLIGFTNNNNIIKTVPNMLIKFEIILITVFIYFGALKCFDQNYYWKEYTRTIPSDAVIGGKDINGDPVYIGQGYVKGGGLIVLQINPRFQKVKAPYGGVKEPQFVKILCSNSQASFKWIVTNSSTVYVDIIGKHAVIGGHEDGFGYIHIGRLSSQGETVLGKVHPPATQNIFYYVDNIRNQEVIANVFEILLYDDNSPTEE